MGDEGSRSRQNSEQELASLRRAGLLLPEADVNYPGQVNSSHARNDDDATNSRESEGSCSPVSRTNAAVRSTQPTVGVEDAERATAFEHAAQMNPSEWERYETDEGETYYYNPRTGRRLWNQPGTLEAFDELQGQGDGDVYRDEGNNRAFVAQAAAVAHVAEPLSRAVAVAGRKHRAPPFVLCCMRANACIGFFCLCIIAFNVYILTDQFMGERCTNEQRDVFPIDSSFIGCQYNCTLNGTCTGIYCDCIPDRCGLVCSGTPVIGQYELVDVVGAGLSIAFYLVGVASAVKPQVEISLTFAILITIDLVLSVTIASIALSDALVTGVRIVNAVVSILINVILNGLCLSLAVAYVRLLQKIRRHKRLIANAPESGGRVMAAAGEGLVPVGLHQR